MNLSHCSSLLTPVLMEADLGFGATCLGMIHTGLATVHLVSKPQVALGKLLELGSGDTWVKENDSKK